MQCPHCGAEIIPPARECSRCAGDVSAEPWPLPPPLPISSLPPPQPLSIPPPLITGAGESAGSSHGFAVTSLILGIASLLFSVFTALPGLIFGILALRQLNRTGGGQSSRGMAITGIVVSSITSLFFPLVVSLVYPAIAQIREHKLAKSCMNQQRKIAQALLIYAEDNGGMLPESTAVWAKLQPEMTNARSFHCPSEHGGPTAISYGFNRRLDRVPISSISNAYELVMTADSNSPAHTINSMEDITMRHADDYTDRYGKMFVASYLDGHVDMKRDRTIKLKPKLLKDTSTGQN